MTQTHHHELCELYTLVIAIKHTFGLISMTLLMQCQETRRLKTLTTKNFKDFMKILGHL